MTSKTLAELVVLAGETNEKNGYNGYAQARADGYGLQYLALKDLLEVGENTEALEEIRNGHTPDEIYLSWPPTPPSLAVEFASGADATEHFQATTKGKLEGYLIEKFDAIIRSFGTIYEVIREHGLDPEETLAHLEGKIEYNAQRADTAKSGVKAF
jgi:hypothetical protein